MKAELDGVQAALRAGLPCLGICLGLQALVKAAGGRVIKGAVKETGFNDPDGNPQVVELTLEGKADPLLEGLPGLLKVFQLHREMVELTPDMKLLATGKFCTNQIVRVAPRAYGIQSHFELTLEMLGVWAEEDPNLVPIGKDRLWADFKAIEQTYPMIGQILLRNFLKIANLG